MNVIMYRVFGEVRLVSGLQNIVVRAVDGGFHRPFGLVVTVEAASLGIEGLGGGVFSENLPNGQSVDSILERWWPFSEFLLGVKHWTYVAKHRWDCSAQGRTRA